MKTVFRAILMCLTLSLFGCEEGMVDNVRKASPRYQIAGASKLEKNKVIAWIDNVNSAGRISSEFDADALQQVTDTENKVSILTILSNDDASVAISFASNSDGEIEFAFKSQTLKDSNGNFVNNIYSTDDVLHLSYIDYKDGTREITFSSNSTNGRTSGFFGDWDKCVGKFHSLTGSNIGDIVVGAVFNAATLGLYTPTSVVFCAAAAALK